jgi:hypothetical protein
MGNRAELQALTSEVRTVAARGRRALKRLEEAGKSHVRGLFARLADEEQVSQAQLRQAVKFAETFSQEELKGFLALRTPGGKPLGISIAYQVMYLSNRRQRVVVCRLAAKNGWSSRDVKAEVQRRVGVNAKSSMGGRRPRLPANLAEALRQLEEKCDQWQRWVGQLEARDEEPGVFSARQLPQTLRNRINVVTSDMNQLAREVAKEHSAKLKSG